MRKSILLIFFFSLNGLIFSQENPAWNLYPGSDSTKTQTQDGARKKSIDLDFNGKQGDVKVTKDERIQSLSNWMGEAQKGDPGVRIKGYRVQIFFDADKDQVNQKRADYLARFNDNPAYVDYLQPNFRLRVGNFRTRLQAQKWQDEIKIEFPDAIIVEDWIDLPDLKDEEKK